VKLASEMEKGTFDEWAVEHLFVPRQKAAADDNSDTLLGSTAMADVGGTDKELKL